MERRLAVCAEVDEWHGVDAPGPNRRARSIVMAIVPDAALVGAADSTALVDAVDVIIIAADWRGVVDTAAVGRARDTETPMLVLRVGGTMTDDAPGQGPGLPSGAIPARHRAALAARARS